MKLLHADLIYHNQTIFRDLSIHFAQGEWTCILGHSGVGKSSLLRMLAQLPIDGKVNFKTDIAANEISYLSQTDTLLPWLTALENVLIYLKLQGKKITSDDKNQAQYLLAQIGLTEHSHKKPKQLSGGQRQRVALAKILFENKNIILMDEPFSAVDAITRKHLQNLAAEYLKEKTVIFITHDPLEALRLGQCIYVLKGNPANLSFPIRLNHNIPRDIDEPEVIKAYKVIINLLEQAQVQV